MSEMARILADISNMSGMWRKLSSVKDIYILLDVYWSWHANQLATGVFIS